MRLLKFENDEKGIWYFTNSSVAARYIESSPSYVDTCRKNRKTCKGWTIEEIEDDNIISKYINPERK